MPNLNPYLTFSGNCEEAFNFYKSVFKNEFDYIGKFKDMPSEEPVPESQKEKIMHVSLPIGKTSILMGSDSSEEFGQKVTQGNNFSISIDAESKEDAERLFNGLSKNGSIIMPLEKTFWSALFGMFIDQFGVQWMVSYNE